MPWPFLAAFSNPGEQKEAVNPAVLGKVTQERPTAKAEPLDINSATKEELRTLPGITDKMAQKIIAYRPYAKKRDLVSNEIIPEIIYVMIKDRIAAETEAKK